MKITLSAFLFVLAISLGLAGAGQGQEPPPEANRVSEATSTPSAPNAFEVVPGPADHLEAIPADTVADGVYVPRVPDVDDEEGLISGSQRVLLEYDVLAEFERQRLVNLPSVEGVRVTQAGEGDPLALQGHDELLPFPRLKDFDAHSFVFDPTVDHYPIHVKIISKYINQNGAEVGSGCSGTLIDPKHVLTAGHCIFKHEDGDGVPVNSWPTSLTVYPGYHGGTTGPWGTANAVRYLSWAEWTGGEDFDYDVGVIELDRPIGGVVGWHGLGTSSNCDHYEGGSWERASYPGEAFSGLYMWEQAGNFDDCDTNAFGWYGNNVQFDRFTYKGQSGNGAERDGAIWAVASHRDAFGTSHDTRIWPESFDDIVAWIDGHSPASRDLHAMDMRAGQTNGLVGDPLTGLSFLAHNYSREEGNAFVSYVVYLSDDVNINSSDTYVTSGSTSAYFSRNGRVRINIPNSFVPQVSSGNYFLGVVITENDADNSNNDTGAFDVKPFMVQCTTQAVPQPALPANGHPCVPTDITLNWGSVPGVGISYQVEVRTTPGLPTTYETSSTLILIENLLPATTYGWRVRASADCGAFSDWSQEFVLTTTGMQPVTLQYPYDGMKCLPTGLALDWQSVPNAAKYRVQLDHLGDPPVYYTRIADVVNISGLIPGETYHWSVTPQDQCGIWGETSERFTFTTTAVDAPGLPVYTSPVNGDVEPALVTLSIADEPFAQAFEWDLVTNLGLQVESGSETRQQGWSVGPLATGNYRWRARYQQCVNSQPVWSDWGDWQQFLAGAEVAECNFPEFGDLDTPTEVDTYAYLAPNGADITIKVEELSGSMTAEWRVLTVDGFPIIGCGSWTSASSRDCNLLATPNPFRIEVRDVGQDDTGSYLIEVMGCNPVDVPNAARFVTQLHPPAPNPFNPRTQLRFELERAAQVDISIYDAAGRLIRVLAGESLPAGPHERVWNGQDDQGRTVATGVYFAKMTVDGRAQSPLRKLALIK